MSSLAQARAEATVPSRDLDDARDFYERVLGLQPAGEHAPGVDVLYECGGGTRVLLYEWSGTAIPSHTVVHFAVDDVAATVRELRDRGVVFEEYDMPELRTVDGVAEVNGRRFAWFKDPSLNTIAIHSA
jgi:catechol 2,3-dioxygenase-like lactoylglutathione lyase family enzyme